MLIGFIADLYAVYAVGQGELRCTVLVGYRLVGVAAVDVFDLDGDAFPKVFRIIVRIDGSHLQRCAAGLRKDCLCRGPYILRVRM